MVLIATQSLKEQEETKEAKIQKAADSGGCVLPGETTQPNATYPLGASGNQMEQLSPSERTLFGKESESFTP